MTAAGVGAFGRKKGRGGVGGEGAGIALKCGEVCVCGGGGGGKMHETTPLPFLKFFFIVFKK